MTGTTYLTGDPLGSTRLVTNPSGTALQRFDYAPFGEELTANIDGRTAPYSTNQYPTATLDGTAQKFTSKERDSETGLDFFGVRYFSGAQGRFTSPDQPFADQHTIDPQSWSMYAYVRNNPLKNIDPNGEQSCAMNLSACGYSPSGPPTAKDAAIATGIVAAPAAITAGGVAGVWGTLQAAGTAVLGWLLRHPLEAQEAAAALGEGLTNAPPGSLTGNLAKLTLDEIRTGSLLAKSLGADLKVGSHVGEEFRAGQQAWDAMGTPGAYAHWNQEAFFNAIDKHLLESNMGRNLAVI